MSGPIGEADAGPENVDGAVPARVLDVLPSRIADVAGSPVHRALPRRARRTIGAWCFLDHFHPEGPDAAPGAVTIGDTHVDPDALVYLGRGRDELRFQSDGSTRVLLLGGTPFEEILMWWNFVARTRDEMNTAYRDWEAHSERFGIVASDLPRIDAPRPRWMAPRPA